MIIRNGNLGFLGSALFAALLTSNAWAGGIKHPSDYGSPPSPIDFTSCGSQTENGVIANCFNGTGPSVNDVLFTFALVTPSASTSITSVTFTLSDIADLDSANPYGLLEGTALDCSAMNISCTPPQITLNDGSPLALGSNTFTFTNFTGNLVATEYFGYDNAATGNPTFTAATTSTATSTPEPSQIVLLTLAFGAVVFFVRRRQAKQNG